MSNIGNLIGDILGTGLTPEEIYEQITNGPGPGSLSDAQDTARSQAELQQAINDRVARLHRLMASGWQGDAGQAASNAATPVAEVAQQATHELRKSQDLHLMQAEAYTHARNTVVPMPPDPARPDFINTPYPMLTDLAEQARAYQQAAETNKTAYEGYHGTSGQVSDTMPTSYGMLMASTSDTTITLKKPDSVGSDGGVVSPPPDVRGDSPHSPHRNAGPVPNGDGGYVPSPQDRHRETPAPPVPGNGTPNEPPAARGDDNTRAAGYAPRPAPAASSPRPDRDLAPAPAVLAKAAARVVARPPARSQERVG
ncbi:PPE domain-containing protein [Amycolatopsis cihanbeyliensis]|uniref:PPE family protein n=1 Tax=Amycolatopsis cihanbeyliensis TaxID=1128664 RepID=A0A542CV05_AMYCI|nr:PPE domain-containing protein [Amycolatopsis cihanbeyliensis]TQI94649.1 PPE family protein [Amycolatopsis cihanbeyliensis]